MAHEFYVTIEGSKQGKLAGESPLEAHKGKLTGVEFHYSVQSPRDAASGMASGRRSHQPVRFVKEWGAATPQLFSALCNSEVLKSVLFEFVKIDPNGEEYVFHTIKLSNANLIELEQYVEDPAPSDAAPSDAGDARPLEKVSLTFQRIEIENVDGKTSAVDEGRAR